MSADMRILWFDLQDMDLGKATDGDPRGGAQRWSMDTDGDPRGGAWSQGQRTPPELLFRTSGSWLQILETLCSFGGIKCVSS